MNPTTHEIYTVNNYALQPLPTGKKINDLYQQVSIGNYHDGHWPKFCVRTPEEYDHDCSPGHGPVLVQIPEYGLRNTYPSPLYLLSPVSNL